MSTRKVDDLMQALGMSGISKPQVSEWCGALDERVNDFLDRPLTARYNLMHCRTPKVYEVGGFHRLAFAPRYLPGYEA